MFSLALENFNSIQNITNSLISFMLKYGNNGAVVKYTLELETKHREMNHFGDITKEKEEDHYFYVIVICIRGNEE